MADESANRQAAPRRFRFRYSLRGMLIVSTAVLLVWGWYVNRTSQQRQAVEKLAAQRAQIIYSYQLPNLGTDNLFRNRSWLTNYVDINFLDHPASVSINHNDDFTDRDLAILGALPRVQWVQFYQTAVEGNDFDSLSRLTGLQRLVVIKSPLGDEALKTVGNFQQLQDLYLVETKITDAGLQHLRGLKNIARVSLSECAITDRGLAALGAWTEVQEASFENTAITDSSAELFHRWQKLRRLSLYGTDLTDAAVPALTQCSARTIHLGRTKISPAGLRAIREGGPKNRFVSPDPDDEER